MKRLVFYFKQILLVMVIILMALKITNAQIWDSLSSDLRGSVKHFHEYDGKLYVGIRDTVDGLYLFNIGVYDGTSWDTLGGGIDGSYVYSSAKFNNKIFLGGDFIYAGGEYPGPPSPGMSDFTSWDGNQYIGYNNFQNAGQVISLCNYQNQLYIGLTPAPLYIDSITYYGIVRFNDTTFTDVGGGVISSARTVMAMTEYNGKLVVAGRFGQAGPLPVNNIATWDGVQWEALGAGLDYYVRALCVDTINNILYAGGSFNYSDTTQMNFVAKWNGLTWEPLGPGIGTTVTAMEIYNGELYIGTNPNFGQVPSSLQKWNGLAWIPIIPYPNGIIYCLKVYNTKLYVGGGFNEIGGIPYAGIAIYSDTSTLGLNSDYKGIKFEIYPNPAIGIININLSEPLLQAYTIEIINSIGEVLVRQNIEKNVQDIRVQLPKTISLGIYHCKISDKNLNGTKKFVVN